MKRTNEVVRVIVTLLLGAVWWPGLGCDGQPAPPARDDAGDAADDRGETPHDVTEDAEANDAEDGEIVTCTAPLQMCGDECVNTMTDARHCSACDTPCDPDYECLSGLCRLICSGQGLACGDECVDRMSDPDNCGACGVRCPEPQVCALGLCVTECPPGSDEARLTPCGRACADLRASIDHCGRCYIACGNRQWCVSGECRDSPCAAGDLLCNDICVPQDENNCGECDLVCGAGITCCDRLLASGMICANLQADPWYCGDCANMCDPGMNCVGGQCRAP